MKKRLSSIKEWLGKKIEIPAQVVFLAMLIVFGLGFFNRVLRNQVVNVFFLFMFIGSLKICLELECLELGYGEKLSMIDKIFGWAINILFIALIVLKFTHVLDIGIIGLIFYTLTALVIIDVLTPDAIKRLVDDTAKSNEDQS